MKCRACEKEINDKEIQFNPELICHSGKIGMFEDCPSCYQIEMEAAYEGGFAYDEEDQDVVILDEFDDSLCDYNFVEFDEEYD